MSKKQSAEMTPEEVFAELATGSGEVAPSAVAKPTGKVSKGEVQVMDKDGKPKDGVVLTVEVIG